MGAPIDLLIYDTDSLRVGTKRRLEENDPYLETVRKGWEDGLRAAFDNLPVSDWV